LSGILSKKPFVVRRESKLGCIQPMPGRESTQSEDGVFELDTVALIQCGNQAHRDEVRPEDPVKTEPP
jgi:hypothetical protein